MSRSLRRAFAGALFAIIAVPSTLWSVQASAAEEPASAPITIKVADSKAGPILVDSKGLTLYMFTADRYKVSNCEGPCLNVWPPLLLGPKQTLADVKLEGSDLRRLNLGLYYNIDGTRQVTYNGWPLYYWVFDKAPGDLKGQWVNNVWFVLNSQGVPNTIRL